MQQHSQPPHSKHFVLPTAPVSGFTIEEMVDAALEPGPLWFTSTAVVVEEHIFRCLVWMLGGEAVALA